MPDWRMLVPRKVPKKRRRVGVVHGSTCNPPTMRCPRRERLTPSFLMRRQVRGHGSESLGELLERLRADQLETQEQRLAIESALSQLTDPVEARERIARLRMEIEEARGGELERRSAHDRLASEAEQRTGRLSSIAGERASWETRVAGAKGRIEELQDASS